MKAKVGNLVRGEALNDLKPLLRRQPSESEGWERSSGEASFYIRDSYVIFEPRRQGDRGKHRERKLLRNAPCLSVSLCLRGSSIYILLNTPFFSVSLSLRGSSIYFFLLQRIQVGHERTQITTKKIITS